jgi:DNA-binding NarL/FixJ family response regulator
MRKEISVYVAVQPSIFQVGLMRVLEEAVQTRPRRWVGGLGVEPHSVAILEAHEPGWEGALAELKQGGVMPNRVLVAGAVHSAAEAADLLALNVAGCTDAAETPEALVEKVVAVADGDWRRSRRDLFEVIQRVPRLEAGPLPLSVHDLETLSLVARGVSNRRIADKLHLAEGTVRNRVSTLYGKIGVRSRGEAIIWAWRHGVGSPRNEGPSE